MQENTRRKLTREEAEKLRKESIEKHKIKAKVKGEEYRDIKEHESREFGEDIETIDDIANVIGSESINDLQGIISDPEKLAYLSESFEKRVSGSSPYFKEVLAKQEEHGHEIDSIIESMDSKFEELLNEQGSVINALNPISSFMEKLLHSIENIEPFVDSEISTSEKYENLRSTYDRMRKRIKDAVDDCNDLIGDIFEETISKSNMA